VLDTEQIYLKQINETPLLNADEEKALARKIKASHTCHERLAKREITLPECEAIEREAQQARDRMVRSNLRLVVNIAKKYLNHGMPLSDLIEEGNLGLLRGVEGFDADHATRFSTYASWWIKQSIRRALINAGQPIHIPAYMVEMISQWKAAQKEFKSKEGREPTIQELSEYLEMPKRKVRIVEQAVKASRSPTQSADPDSGMGLTDTLADEKTPSPDEALLSESENEWLASLVNLLDEREAKILRLRYGLNSEQEKMNLKEIGKEIGLTRERVRQIEHEALAKLNHLIEEETIIPEAISQKNQ
jgi:RNA polymerase primary sigma factor